MDEQTKKAVAKAIDNTLTTVAIQEYNRLAYRLNRDQISDSISEGLKSLRNLQSGDIPSYDDWVALLYHWYQPSQINLAYSLTKSTAVVNDKLRVVDFGCGALAMQLGVTLAAADALEQMESISEIRVDSLDSSQSMVNIGKRVWEQFKVEVNKDSCLRYVSLACEIIRPQTILLTNPPSMIGLNSNTAWATAWQSECWLSALHAVYEENRDNVQRWLNSIVERLSPNVCFATTHSSRGDLLQEVWGFMDYAEYYLPVLTIEPQFNGVLPEITQWRKNLNSALHINHSYLDRNVTWEWPNAAFRIHFKGQMPMDDDDLPW